jgi:hypothetical protein
LVGDIYCTACLENLMNEIKLYSNTYRMRSVNKSINIVIKQCGGALGKKEKEFYFKQRYSFISNCLFINSNCYNNYNEFAQQNKNCDDIFCKQKIEMVPALQIEKVINKTDTSVLIILYDDLFEDTYVSESAKSKIKEFTE